MSAVENPAAFPLHPGIPPADPAWAHSQGMSLRDWFAGQALSGFCSMSDSTGCWSWLPQDAAAEAYELADAMLAERKNGGAK